MGIQIHVSPTRAMLLALALAFSCANENQQLQWDLQASFNRFAKAVRNPTPENLQKTVFIPNVKNYKSHVTSLLTKYLDQAAKGSIHFDEQGIVATRFLALDHNRYQILSAEKAPNGNTANMRIGVNFSYDANIEYNQYQEGTKVFVPGSPWGKVHVITIGGANDVPREQLSYIELDVRFRKTNVAGHWQVRTVQPLPESAQYITSYKVH